MDYKELDPKSSSCLMCGSPNLKNFRAFVSNSAVGSDEKITIKECEDCSFAWQYPLKTSTDKSVRYFENAYKSGLQKGQYFDPLYKKEIASLKYNFITQILDSKGTLLDIGAGAGIFAEIYIIKSLGSHSGRSSS